MSTITIRRSVSGAPIPAPGIAGAFGASEPGSSDDLEVSIDIDTLDPEILDRAALSATAAFNVVESFADAEPGVIEFVDAGIPIPDPDPTGEYPDGWHQASQTETGIVYTEADAAAQAASGLEETEVDGKLAEELGLQDGAAYYITSFDDEHALAIYALGYFEDRDGSWGLDDVKSFRFAAPAVSN